MNHRVNNSNYYKSRNRSKLMHILKTHFSHIKNSQYVLVGGTNGKGSTANILQQLLQTKFKKVGILTSPHLCYVNERIRINSSAIDNSSINTIVKKYVNIFIKYRLSYYEILFFIALEYFWINNTDFAILEIGIGGEFDACNIVDPQLSILTNVAFDHMNVLGTTLSNIAKTKAYICRENKKLVLGFWIKGEPLKSIKQIVKKRKSSISTVGLLLMKYYQNHYYQFYKNIPKHLVKNTALAIHAAILLGVEKKEIGKSLKNGIQIPWGRFNYLSYKQSTIMIDGAHNLHGIKALIQTLKGDDWIVFFASKFDKDYFPSVQLLTKNDQIKKIYLASFFKGVEWNDINAYKLNCEVVGSNWFKVFKKIVNEQPRRILFCGSLYFVGEVYRFFKLNEKTKQPYLLTPKQVPLKIEEL